MRVGLGKNNKIKTKLGQLITRRTCRINLFIDFLIEKQRKLGQNDLKVAFLALKMAVRAAVSHTAGLGNSPERKLFNSMFSDFVNPCLDELFFQLGSIAFHVSPPKSIHCLLIYL
ncbi:hypothetical protein K4I03_2444 [Streptococcus sanguinis]|nr:hypothetical protein [Streptococcus sanguinis]